MYTIIYKILYKSLYILPIELLYEVVYNITTVKKSNGANRHTVRSRKLDRLLNNKGDKRNEYEHINSKGQRVKGT